VTDHVLPWALYDVEMGSGPANSLHATTSITKGLVYYSTVKNNG